MAVTAGTGVLAGALPAWSAARVHLVETLKEGGRGSTAGGVTAWFRNALVVAEVAVSVLLLAGAGLMIQTFWKLNGMNAGFRTENITPLQTAAPGTRYHGPAAVQLVGRVRKEFASLPGVISVAGASAVPLLDAWGRSFTAEGRPVLGLKDAPLINHVVVTPGYFQTLGIPILEGRDFAESDGKNPLITIVDQEIARRVARNQSLRILRRNTVYLPHGGLPIASMAYLLHTSNGLADPAKALRARMTAIDRNVAISRVLSMKDAVTAPSGRSVSLPRFSDSSPGWRCCWRWSGSMAFWPTRFRGAGTRWASAWRWALRPARFAP
ncbi:MAG: hypothetical protein LAP87_01695 [Acidobacteriia bacterium]|nr:hypothetical protein [Terriglobia bacterium]